MIIISTEVFKEYLYSHDVVFTHHRRILFQQNWGHVQNFDKQVVNVVLEVDDLLALTVEFLLQVDHHLDEVLPGLPVVLSEDVMRQPGSGHHRGTHLRLGGDTAHQVRVVTEAWNMFNIKFGASR